MSDTFENGHQIRALAMRVAALEDNVAFLEQWCEEQQDVLDRAVDSVGCDYEIDRGPETSPRTVLRVVDLREPLLPSDSGDNGHGSAIVAVVETEHDRRIRQIRAQLNRVRLRLAATLAPADDRPAEAAAGSAPPSPAARRVSAKPAGRTAP